MTEKIRPLILNHALLRIIYRYCCLIISDQNQAVFIPRPDKQLIGIGIAVLDILGILIHHFPAIHSGPNADRCALLNIGQNLFFRRAF